jgi:TPR repeat protein
MKYLLGVTLLAALAPVAWGLDARANVEKAVELIEAGEHSLARSYLDPALIDPRLSPGERSRAYYLRGFSFLAEDLAVSARKDLNRALEFNPQNPGALYALGRLHFYGRGTAVDRGLALSLFEQAAELDHVGSIFHLGYAYLNGEGVEPDLEKGRGYLSKSAAAGHPYSMVQLAASYRAPLAVEPDPNQALEWYEQAVAAGEPSAYLAIGYMHANGEFGEQDPASGVEAFRLAAEAGVPAAFLSLGHAYLTGRGVAIDYAAARSNYEQAARLGIAASYVGLAHIYDAGLGVPADPGQARAMYEQGAERGDLNAQLRLAYLLLSEGTSESREAALKWLRQAVAQDSAQAHNDYAWLLATSKRDDLRNGTLAIRHAKQAVEFEKNAAYLDTLAAAYAENGQFSEAIETQLAALALVGEQERDLRSELEAHLSRYQSSEPWRE